MNTRIRALLAGGLFTSACLLVVGCTESSDDGTNENASGGQSSAGGASAGGTAATGGASSGGSGAGAATGGSASGGNPSGGSSSGGAPSTPSVVDSPFTSLEGWSVAPKGSLIPGATATIEDDGAASDGSVLSLTVPGNEALVGADYAGPGAHAIEVVADAAAQLYGRYELNVRFASCASDEELVNGLFTYFNDGSDADGDDIADNSEIDIELLCGEPQFLFLTVWTDYEDDTHFRKSTRIINMRTGQYSDSPKGASDYEGIVPAGSISGLSITDFPDENTFYHLGFEWRETFVRYFLVTESGEVELWKLEGKDYVPQRPAKFLMNLWHSTSHWNSGGAADYPANDASLLVDWVKIWE